MVWRRLEEVVDAGATCFIMILQTLLVCAVAVSPLLAGIRDASAHGVSTVAVGSPGSSPLDGGRQDDAGTLAEENGEDEIEQDDSRIEHGWMAAMPDSAADVPGRFSPVIHRILSPVRSNRTALSRGPPARS